MTTYRVRAGHHVDRDRTVYRQGDLIESDEDLMGMFVNKFALVGADAPEAEADDVDRYLDRTMSRADKQALAQRLLNEPDVRPARA